MAVLFRPPRRRLTLMAALVLAAGAAGATVGDVLYVNRVSLPIRTGKFAFDKVVGTAVQGETLTVTAVDGQWLKVRYAPKAADPSQSTPPPVEGYVMEQALSARAVAAATAGPTNSATGVASAGAGRGLLDSGKYATAKGLNPDPFYKMVTDSRAAVNDANFDEFTRSAHIGPHKPNPTTLPQ